MSNSQYAIEHKKLGLCRSCPKPVVKGSSIFCLYHREKDRVRGRIKEKKTAIILKKEILDHYGKTCACCGETIIDFLTLEHIEGNGNIHRMKLFKHNVGGVHMYRWIKRNNFPSGYSVLCMNCNWAKRYGGICPHKLGRGD
jgi:hypothetical protein